MSATAFNINNFTISSKSLIKDAILFDISGVISTVKIDVVNVWDSTLY